MGKRKLRFSICKNFERKRYSSQQQFVVSIPIEHWMNRFSAISPQGSQPSSDTHANGITNSTTTTILPTSIVKLIVSIPLEFYIDLPISDLKILYERVCKLNVLPIGWCIEDDVQQSAFFISKSFSFGAVAISIMLNGIWTVHVSEMPIEIPNQEKISTVTILLKLLKKVDSSSLCIGNPDTKFFSVRDRRNGKFLDQSGK